MGEEKQKNEPVRIGPFYKSKGSGIVQSHRKVDEADVYEPVEHTDDGAFIITRPDGKRVKLYLP